MRKMTWSFLIIFALSLIPARQHAQAQGIVGGRPSMRRAVDARPYDTAIIQIVFTTLDAVYNADGLPEDCWFAITNVSELNGITSASVACVSQPEGWNIMDGVAWAGVVEITNGVGELVRNESVDTGYGQLLSGDASIDFASPQAGIVTYGVGSFPTELGKGVQYGPLGAHERGFDGYPNYSSTIGFPEWAAIDLVSWYADGMASPLIANNGNHPIRIVWVCNDGLSVAVGVATTNLSSESVMMVYAHMLDNPALKENIVIPQGGSIGVLKAGSFSGSCGYADQQSDHYHLHLGFQFVSGTLFRTRISQYEYSDLDDCWYGVDGISAACPGDLFVNVTTDGGTGVVHRSHIWDFLLSGAINMTTPMRGGLPDHRRMNLAGAVGSIAAFFLYMIYMVVSPNINLIIPFIVISVILTLEVGRWVVAALIFILSFVLPIK